MAKKVLELDTPFRKNEKVITTRSLGPIPEGAVGKVKLINGLTSWNRYWVQFNDGPMVGSIDHDDLVRPAMLTGLLPKKPPQAPQKHRWTLLTHPQTKMGLTAAAVTLTGFLSTF